MRSRVAAVFLLCLMAGVSALTSVVQPKVMLADELGTLNVEEVIPKAFGDWTLDQGQAYVINPQVQATLDKIYSQTLSRTYVNSRGERVMLSVAYGLDQRDAMQVHYPEVCYPAQGFYVSSNSQDQLNLKQGVIPVRRLETSLANQRFEPVTYWTTVGEKVVSGNSGKKVAEMYYGVRGYIPDGLLFRVSSIDRNSSMAFKLQDQFVGDLLAALPARKLTRLTGLGVLHSLPNRSFSWLIN